MKQRNLRKYWIIGIFIIIILIFGWLYLSSQKTTSKQCNLEKITFDLDQIDERLRVTSHVSVDYEFCIPYGNEYLQKIKEIDTHIECYHGSSGRIGCNDVEHLCIGNTGYKDFRSILCSLSTLEYINRIDQTFWE